MANDSDKNVIVAEQLEALAIAAKNYTLAEIANSGGGSGVTNATVFTGATSVIGGASGFVPAPQAGDNEKFLRGDGQWVTIDSGKNVIAGTGSELVLSNVESTVNGAMWISSLTASTAGEAITLSTLMPATVVNGSMWLEI